uniref:Uncharacterized protein n=1 Tax=Solanum tuberosum TaxID=4113 RepID=M1B079_SOLTU
MQLDIEIVEKCCGPQTRCHVFGFRGGVKAKDLKGGTSSKVELLSALRSTREYIKSLNEENKSLNEENKSLNDRLSTIEDKMKEIMQMKELLAAQQSHVPPITSVSTELPLPFQLTNVMKGARLLPLATRRGEARGHRLFPAMRGDFRKACHGDGKA